MNGDRTIIPMNAAMKSTNLIMIEAFLKVSIKG